MVEEILGINRRLMSTGQKNRQKSLEWWRALSIDEKKRIAVKHLKEKVDSAGFVFVFKSSSMIEQMFLKEKGS